MPEVTVIQLKHGPAQTWKMADPVLEIAELGFEHDTRLVKIGDGITDWNNLPYFSGPDSLFWPTVIDGGDAAGASSHDTASAFWTANPTEDLHFGPSYQSPIGYFTFGIEPDTSTTPSVIVAVSDYRRRSADDTSSLNQPPLFADGPAGLKVWLEPQFATGVSKYHQAGVSVAGFVGQGSDPGVDLSGYGYFAAYASHLDTNENIYGLYWGQIHLGSFAPGPQGLFEMGGLDLNAMNAWPGAGYAAHAFMIRCLDGNIGGNMGSDVDPWALYLGNYDSVHRGNLLIGGTTTLVQNAYRSHPVAQLDIHSTATLGNDAAALTPLRGYQSKTANDSVQSQVFQGWSTTTTSASTGAAIIPIGFTHQANLVSVRVLGKRTGGSAGSTDDCAAWRLDFLVKNGAVVGSPSATVISNAPGWPAPAAFAALGAVNVSVTGVTNNNITWWAEFDILGPLGT